MQAVRADPANGSLAAAHARAAAVMTLIASHGALLHEDTGAASSGGTCHGGGDAGAKHHSEQVNGRAAHEADAVAAAVARATGAEEAGEGRPQQPAQEQGVQQGKRASGEAQPGSDWAEMYEAEGGGSGAAVKEHGVSSATAEAAAAARESRNGLEHPQHAAARATPEEPASDPGVSEQQQDGQQGSSRAAAEMAKAREHCLRVSTCHPPYVMLKLRLAMLASKGRGVSGHDGVDPTAYA